MLKWNLIILWDNVLINCIVYFEQSDSYVF